MKVCIVADNIYPPYGGMEQSILRQAKVMREMGLELFGLTARKPGESSSEHLECMRLYRFRGIPQPKTKPYIYWAIPSKHKIMDILRRERPDVIHIHFPTYLALVTLKASKQLGIPTVFTHHTHIEQILPNIPVRDYLLRRIHKYIEKWFEYIYNRVDVIITLTPKAKERIKSKFPHKRVEWISNGVPIEDFVPKFQKSEYPTVLYVGRLMAEKNVPTLIRAMKIVEREHRDAVTIIRGDGYMKNEIENLCRKLSLRNVCFLPRLEYEDLLRIYDSSWVLVLPSYSEPEGLTALEAMAMATPVIVSNTADISYHMIIDGYNGFKFDPYSPLELSEKIKTIIKDRDISVKMGKNAREIAERFSLRKCVGRTLKIYEEISS